MEIWDAYNENEELLGMDLVRGQAIPTGLYHLVVDVLVKHTDGDYLLMQRDFSKAGYPGYFEASAGGSALKGESATEAAIREVREETGLSIQEIKLVNRTIGNDKDWSENSIIWYSFESVTDNGKDTIILQEAETISFKWLGRDDFLRFVDSDKCIPSFRVRFSHYLELLRKE